MEDQKGCGSCRRCFRSSNTGVACCTWWIMESGDEPSCSQHELDHGCDHWEPSVEPERKKCIDLFERNIREAAAAIEELAEEKPVYVIVLGDLEMPILIEGTKAHAVRAGEASRFGSEHLARRYARTIFNGHGQVGRVVPLVEAYYAEIESNRAALEMILP